MTETDLESSEEDRNWRQDKLLTIDEIERLQRGVKTFIYSKVNAMLQKETSTKTQKGIFMLNLKVVLGQVNSRI